MLIAPTHSGKTTVAHYLCKTHGATLIKIAEPIIKMQSEFYKTIGKAVMGQDGELLQFLGEKFEREAPGWLCKEFMSKVALCDGHTIVNDDCRPNCYDLLKSNGFVVIYVHTSESLRMARARVDHTRVNPHHPVERGIGAIEWDFEIQNNGSVEETYRQCDELIRRIA
jgi:dephospho-CoA kinase